MNHAKYNNDDYDLWYYKMYFRTLIRLFDKKMEYHILVDIKDTKGGKRIQKLKEVMCNIMILNGEVITHIGQINSAESEILQLAEILLNGALAYHYRNLAK